LEGFEIEDVAPVERKPATLAEVLDDAAETADKWRDYAYLRDKEARDKAAGKGFRRQLLTPEAERVPTITREYQKVRSTDPQLAHPSDPRLS
ncbi:DNA cytosine methyltransferase, partial [Pantoea sp. SIMBA_133]